MCGFRMTSVKSHGAIKIFMTPYVSDNMIAFSVTNSYDQAVWGGERFAFDTVLLNAGDGYR